MKKFRHIILALTALILASCAVDEFWEGTDYAEGEEVVMTFKPRFEDFESVTKAIGDGKKVDTLLVQVYDELGKTPVFSKEYGKDDWKKVQIAFYYGKTYTVYFWAYNSERNPYKIAEGGLKNGVTVTYPDEKQNLAYDALEHLDAFYAVETINLSDNIYDNTTPSLTRPFAQVNLVANRDDLAAAQASEVQFTINVAKTFNLTSPTVEEPTVEEPTEEEPTEEQTFTFTIPDNLETREQINGNVYLGTTYLFPSSEKVTGKVKLCAGNNELKSKNIEIPLVGNKRTNLVFSGFQISVPEWDSSKQDVPEASDDYWITITEPEQLAALLMEGTTEETKVRIGSTLNMEKMPQEVKDAIAGKSFNALTLDGNNLTIKNFAAPAFFANATNLTVSNLTLENVNITAATHVGVLVNELKGNGTFTNVTVKGSSATTNSGAAGGFVGRSVRIYEMERSETLALTFTGCRIEGTDDKKIVATGSLAEGKFVGLFSGYDNGEKLVFTNCTSENANVADYKSRYVEGNEGAWLAGNDYSAYNGFLGDETYLRGQVYFVYFVGEDKVTIRFCPKWDGGKTSVVPLLANATYDSGTTAGTNRYVVYSPFDLAGVRDKTASPAAIYLMNNVDMFGQGDDGVAASPKPNRPSVEISDDNLFNPFEKVSYLDGMNFTIHNLSVEQVHNTNLGGTAFIRMASGETTHQNLTLSNPDIKAYSTDPISDGNAYAGTLVSTVTGKYSASNIQILGGNVFAICKMGGLYGRISQCSSFNISNCIVDGITLRNYDSGYNEVFLDTTLMGIRFLVQFHSDGEVGGLIGFITGSDAVISDCQVKNSNIYCTGENDWEAEAIIAKAQVPGRHVNSFIGDVRTTRGETISISRCTLNNNNLHKSEGYAENKYKEFRRYSWNSKSWECFGFVYAVTVKFNDVPGTVKVDNKSVHVSQSIVTAKDKSIN